MSTCISLCAAFVALFVVGVSSQDFRLPTHVRPVHCDLRVTPWLDDRDFTFDGWVSIKLAVDQAASNITLHNKFLAVEEDLVVLLNPAGEEVPIGSHEYEWDYADFHVIHLTEDLVPTAQNEFYELQIPYQGVMTQAPPTRGLWYAEDLPGTYLAATQMQPVYTRRVFPCFDEPSFKATFNITVGRRKTATALSNMPLVDTYPSDEDDRYEYDVFATTPSMSSYLVAFSVGDLYQVDVGDNLQSLVVRGEYTESYMFPLSRLPVIMAELESAFGYAYPLPKLDHVAMPLFGGGMENFGHIVYGEVYILPEDDSDISFPTALLTHETAHMWTGDIVTCSWWDVAWLNEGLTHFFTHWIGSKVEPSTELFTMLGAVLVESSMKAEQQLDSRPMAAETITPDEVELQFDIDLVYNRGGFIGRMLYYLLTEGVFLQGMNNHVVANEFGPVDEDDLWDAMQLSVDENGLTNRLPPIAGLMQEWTRQAGFPLVTVTRNYEEGTATVRQKRFIYTEGNVHDDDTQWIVPLTWTSANGSNFEVTLPDVYLLAPETLLNLEAAADSDWLIFNPQRVFYYRVNYDQRNWELILEQLLTEPDVIHEMNRAQLTGDVMILCGVQLVDREICAAWPLYLAQKETSPHVWEVAAMNFNYLQWMYGSDDAYKSSIETVIRFAEVRLNWIASKNAPSNYRLNKTLEVLANFKEHLIHKSSMGEYHPSYYLKWKNYIHQE